MARIAACLAVVVPLAACTVQFPDPLTKACDEAHPCPQGYACVAGSCSQGCSDARLGGQCTAGVGECAKSDTWRCAAGDVLECPAVAGAPTAEACDGRDNDCDGSPDNGLAPPPCALTRGVCAGKVKRCGGAAGWLDCSASEYGQSYEATEVSCDGADNDCDGWKDNAQGCVSTVAGGPPPGFADGPLDDARFARPDRVLALASGDLLVTDAVNRVVRRVSFAAGRVTVEAGTPGRCGDVDGPVGVGRICRPTGIAEAADGTVYVADATKCRLRALKSGTLSTVAGTGTCGVADGPALSAGLMDAGDIAVAGGKVYLADGCGCRVRVFDGQRVDTIAGQSCGSPLDGQGAAARFGCLYGIAYVASRNALYVADSDNARIRVVNLADAQVSTLAGATWGLADGNGSAARFRRPTGLAADANGVYVADSDNNRIRYASFTGDVTTVAGTDPAGVSDGAATAIARLNLPTGVTVRGSEVFFVGSDHRVRKLDRSSGNVVTVAGGAAMMLRDGAAASALFFVPQGVAANTATGTVYVSDSGNLVIRSVGPDGQVATVAGSGTSGYADGALRDARFSDLRTLLVRPDGKLLVADGWNAAIRLVDFGGDSVSTFVRGASLSFPYGLALGPGGEIYVTDRVSYAVFTITANGATTRLLAGASGSSGYVDGPGSSARFGVLRGIALGPDGKLYLADSGNHAIRSVDRVTGETATVAGTGSPGDTDGPLGVGLLNEPAGVAFVGNDLYITSTRSHTIRKLSGGALSTAAGTSSLEGVRDGPAVDASFYTPWMLAPAPGGGILVSEYDGHRIRRFVP